MRISIFELRAGEFEAQSASYTKWRDAYGCLGILNVSMGESREVSCDRNIVYVMSLALLQFSVPSLVPWTLLISNANTDGSTLRYIAVISDCKSHGVLIHEIFHVSSAGARMELSMLDLSC